MAAGRCCARCSGCNWRRRDEALLVVAEIDPLANMQPLVPERVEPTAEQLAAGDPAPQPGSPELLNRLRRPEALDVPAVRVARWPDCGD